MSVWNVYIDETYLDNIQQARIITSFFAIDGDCKIVCVWMNDSLNLFL